MLLLHLSCPCSLAREDVSYSNSEGAKASLRFTTKPFCLTLQQVLCCTVVLNCSVPLHVCAGRPHFQVSSHPPPSRGPHSRCPCRAPAFRHVMTCHARVTPVLWGRKGVPMFHHRAFQLFAAMAAHTTWSARTHHPPTVPVSPRLLLYGSLSPSLPLSLPCPHYPSLSLSLSLSPSL